MNAFTTNPTGAHRRTWRFPRMLLRDHVMVAAMWWAGLVIACLCLAALLARFAEVPGSIWEPATNGTPWYVAAFGGYVAYHTIPILITHGHTRRSAAVEMVIYMVVFSAAVSLMVTAGYLIEDVVYGIASWPRDFLGEHLFSSHLDVPMIFMEYGFNLLVWSAAGTLVGAMFYRYGANGWLTLIPASILVGMVGVNHTGPPFMGLVLQEVPSIASPSPWTLAPISIACFLAALAMTWLILRDLPIRNR